MIGRKNIYRVSRFNPQIIIKKQNEINLKSYDPIINGKFQCEFFIFSTKFKPKVHLSLWCDKVILKTFLNDPQGIASNTQKSIKTYKISKVAYSFTCTQKNVLVKI